MSDTHEEFEVLDLIGDMEANSVPRLMLDASPQARTHGRVSTIFCLKQPPMS